MESVISSYKQELDALIDAWNANHGHQITKAAETLGRQFHQIAQSVPRLQHASAVAILVRTLYELSLEMKFLVRPQSLYSEKADYWRIARIRASWKAADKERSRLLKQTDSDHDITVADLDSSIAGFNELLQGNLIDTKMEQACQTRKFDYPWYHFHLGYLNQQNTTRRDLAKAVGDSNRHDLYWSRLSDWVHGMAVVEPPFEDAIELAIPLLKDVALLLPSLRNSTEPAPAAT